MKMVSFICALCLCLAHLLVWAAHKTVPLSLTANDLGFFTNNTPNAGVLANEWFYAPLWVGAVWMAYWAREHTLLNRLCVGVVSIGFAALGLPRYEQLEKLRAGFFSTVRQSDFTAQFLITLLVISLIVGLVLIPQKTTDKKMGVWVNVLPMIGLVLVAVPLAGLVVIRPFIAQLYNDFVGLGAGWWLTLCTESVLLVLTFVKIMQAHRTTRH